MKPGQLQQGVQVLESILTVMQNGGQIVIDVTPIGEYGPEHRLGMPALVWRAFCRRQLAVPPPLPPFQKPI